MTVKHAYPAAIAAGALTTALATAGAVKVRLFNASFAFNAADDDVTAIADECSGGTYTPTDLDTIAFEIDGTKVTWTANPCAVPRPDDTPAFVMLERVSDRLPLVVMAYVDDAADPTIVTFEASTVLDQDTEIQASDVSVDTTGFTHSDADELQQLAADLDGAIDTLSSLIATIDGGTP